MSMRNCPVGPKIYVTPLGYVHMSFIFDLEYSYPIINCFVIIIIEAGDIANIQVFLICWFPTGQKLTF